MEAARPRWICPQIFIFTFILRKIAPRSLRESFRNKKSLGKRAVSFEIECRLQDGAFVLSRDSVVDAP